MIDRLPSEAVEHWREYGYVVVRLLDEDEVEAVLANVEQYLPSWEDYDWHRPRYRHFADPVATRETFPFIGTALNRRSVHPALVDFAERLLRTDRLLLNESQLIGKYAGTYDFEDLQVDYGNTTLVYPPDDEQVTDLPMIA